MGNLQEALSHAKDLQYRTVKQLQSKQATVKQLRSFLKADMRASVSLPAQFFSYNLNVLKFSCRFAHHQ